MSRFVNIYEAKTTLSKLLTRVEAGEEITIARNGRPVAMLVPVAHRQPRTPGLFAGQIQLSRDFDDVTASDLEEWYGE